MQIRGFAHTIRCKPSCCCSVWKRLNAANVQTESSVATNYKLEERICQSPSEKHEFVKACRTLRLQNVSVAACTIFNASVPSFWGKMFWHPSEASPLSFHFLKYISYTLYFFLNSIFIKISGRIRGNFSRLLKNVGRLVSGVLL